MPRWRFIFSISLDPHTNFPLFWRVKGQRKASNLDSLDTVLGSSMTLGCLHLEEETFPYTLPPFSSTDLPPTELQIFEDKGLSSQSYGFSSSHVWMWELDHKEGCAPKNWCFQIMVLEKTLESPLDCKEIKPANPKGNQLWIFIGRTDAEAEAPILWALNLKSWLIGKDPDAEKDWRQEEKRMAEDEMVGRHHQLYGRKSEQTPGDGEEQGRLVCCSPWGRRVRWYFLRLPLETHLYFYYNIIIECIEVIFDFELTDFETGKTLIDSFSKSL